MTEGRPGPLRHLAAVGALPFTVAVVIPALLVASSGTRIGWGLDGIAAALVIQAGAMLILAGLALFIRTVTLFDRIGSGTLAPWDPTTELVATGPYLHVRNPMITGVATVLAGEAVLLGSVAIAIELAAFAAINAVYMPLVEEPGLRRRFGAAYDDYRRAVPRWLPRLRPASPPGTTAPPKNRAG